MKICFLIDDFSAVGGIQRVVSLISSELAKNNEVHVVSMYQEYGDNNKNLYYNGVKLKTLIKGKKEYLKQCFKVVHLLKDYLKEEEIKLLISSSEMLCPYCLLSTRKTSIPYICWSHTPAFNNSESFLQPIFKAIGLKTALKTLVLTEDTKELLLKKYKNSNIVVIPNPIDPSLIKDVKYDSNSKEIISVGRVCYQKYYEKLVEVASIVMPNHLDWKWNIYGDGSDIDVIKELIEKNNLENQVILKGSVNNIYDLYQKHSFQVITSRYEGFPMTLLEGLANGLPLVGFDISGVNSLIKNDINGYLIEKYNAKEMANKIEVLINKKDIRMKMSNNSVNMRNKYEINKVINEWNKQIVN